MRHITRGLIPVLLLLLPSVAVGEIVDVGVVSFDNLIPAGIGPGVNVFDVSDFTGATWSLPPDFPVITELTFQNSTLTLAGSGGPQVISLGNIAPGLYTPASGDQFPDTATFTSATFTATLSTLALELYDGSPFDADSYTVSASLLPSSGSTLEAGVDFAVVSVVSVPTSGAPEPRPAVLLGAGFTLLMVVSAGRWKTARSSRGRE